MRNRFFYRIIDQANPKDSLLDVFQSRLATKGMREGSPRYAPLVSTISHLVSLEAKSVLIQCEVQDPDFTAEHETYYSRWNASVPKYCDRLHFFTSAIDTVDAVLAIDSLADTPNSYLGFITLRPISMSPIAASILKPRECKGNHFILSQDKFTVNIAGRSFYVDGTPFMQQDNAVGACAQASIWMALRTLRRKEGQAAFSPAQITNAATRFLVLGRTLPNRTGLSLEQVGEAVRAAGYAPHIIPIRSKFTAPTPVIIEKAKRSLYPYIESGIPVLIALYPTPSDGHAVLLIGHSWNENHVLVDHEFSISNPSWANDINIYDSSAWIEPFIIHNDNTGPYQELPASNSNGYTLEHAISAIPFMHPDIFIDGDEAKKTFTHLLVETIEDLMNKLGEDDAEENWTPPNIVLRIYLQDRSVLRKTIFEEPNIPNELKRYYREKWLPKRVWVAELNSVKDYGKTPEGTATQFGKILLDPASEPEDGAFLTIHLNKELLPAQNIESGVVIDRDGLDGSIEAFPVPDSNYSPLVRTNNEPDVWA